MPKTKTATLNLRIDPRIKEGICIAADKDHRSIANMVEIRIRHHCAAADIRSPEQNQLFQEKSPGSAQIRIANWQPDQREIGF